MNHIFLLFSHSVSHVTPQLLHAGIVHILSPPEEAICSLYYIVLLDKAAQYVALELHVAHKVCCTHLLAKVL